MRTFLMTLHILTCLSLIVVVLLQRGKGADMGAAFGGGGANTVFGARGAGNFLTRITTGAAVIFMVTSLSLSYIATQDAGVTIFDDESLIEEPLGGALEELGEAPPLETDAIDPDALVPFDASEEAAPPSDALVEIPAPTTAPNESGSAPDAPAEDAQP